MPKRICGAKAKQNYGLPCRQPAMIGKNRCRLHGGKSTGPKTPAGKIKSARANLKHGMYTKQAIAERLMLRTMMQWRHDLDSEL
ncbi:MAG TPA: HGGxSTG domain-containing protein [Candidatus Babeliales bacterium]|jgi:hypothetical protein|nr:HGGxSTG domain-containing protein [Candidatus Babeliales bacterium]